MLIYNCDCQDYINLKKEQAQVISVNFSQNMSVFWRKKLKQLQDDVAILALHEERLSGIQKQQMIQILQKNVEFGIERLDLQAEHINSLALQLEAEIINFQKLASDINPVVKQLIYLNDKSYEQSTFCCTPPLSIWQIHSSIVPILIKRNGVFILTAKKVELFQKDYQTRAKLAQRRREKFENWLLQQRH